MATFDPALLVDHLANNYNLEDIYRDDLHSFLSVTDLLPIHFLLVLTLQQIVQPLPEVQLKIALVQQATALQTQQMLSEVKQICVSFRGTMTDVQNLISQNIVFTKDQQAEVTAACKLQIFDGRQIEFDNNAIKADIMDDEDEEPSTVPTKRSRNGNRKKATGDKEYLEDFWVEVGALFKEKNKSWGSDLKAPGWALFIDVSIAEEQCLHPEDSLPLIPSGPPESYSSSRSYLWT
ncbi:hypothetical protein B0H10DRAFT_2446441 [Mycena sp. CBHHK59/15]|nr:hypothetical protein B0H10DRAFT_2446441 [Mycena sp. CBHHK59/15]